MPLFPKFFLNLCHRDSFCVPRCSDTALFWPELTSQVLELGVLCRSQSRLCLWQRYSGSALRAMIFPSSRLANSLGKSFILTLEYPALPVTLGIASYFFELLQFFSTGATLWSAFCWSGRMGFWAYSRILKSERNFQVGDSRKSCTWLLCDTAPRNSILSIVYVSAAVWSWVLYNLPDKMQPTWDDAQGSFESWGGFHCLPRVPV